MSLNQDQKHEIRNALISIWAYARHLEEQEKLIIRQQLKRIEEALNRNGINIKPLSSDSDGDGVPDDKDAQCHDPSRT